MASRRLAIETWFAVSDEDPLASERRSSLLSRLVFGMTGAISLALGVWLLSSGLDRNLGVALLAATVIRFGGIYLEVRGHPGIGFVVAALTGAVLYAAAMLDLGGEAGLQVWALLLVGMPPLIMGPQHGRLRPIVFIGNAAIVAAVEVATRLTPPRVVLPPDVLSAVRGCNLAATVVVMAVLVAAYRRLLDRAGHNLAEARKLSERLLGNILPGPIALRLKREENPIADEHEAVTVMFADMVNFTEFAAQHPAAEVVNRLNSLFQAFDDMVERRGLEKIKTIGDAYMVAGGLPQARADHAEAVAALALEMLAFVEALARDTGRAVAMRVGMHSGRLVAGVIGKHKFSYDVWGDTVNTAARLETAGEPGRIHISEATRRALGRAAA
jgi:class 3 adenylate cyclase